MFVFNLNLEKLEHLKEESRACCGQTTYWKQTKAEATLNFSNQSNAAVIKKRKS